MDEYMINFGFSGNARAETEIAHLIADMNLSAMVMEYDHKAPTAEFLLETHEQFFKIIRNENKHIPIIVISGHFLKIMMIKLFYSVVILLKLQWIMSKSAATKMFSLLMVQLFSLKNYAQIILLIKLPPMIWELM